MLLSPLYVLAIVFQQKHNTDEKDAHRQTVGSDRLLDDCDDCEEEGESENEHYPCGEGGGEKESGEHSFVFVLFN